MPQRRWAPNNDEPLELGMTWEELNAGALADLLSQNPPDSKLLPNAPRSASSSHERRSPSPQIPPRYLRALLDI